MAPDVGGRSLAAALATALAVAGCGGGSTAFLVSDGLASLVLATVDGEAITLEAVDLAIEPTVERTPPEDATTYALGYRTTLDQLGLTVGPLSRSPDGTTLPAPDQQHRLDGEAWSTLPALPAALAEVRVATVDGCATFVQAARSLPRTTDEPTFSVTLDTERVLVGWISGRLEIHERGRDEEVATSTAIPHRAGFMYGGEVWLAGAGGRVVRGHPDRGFVDAPPQPLAAGVLAMDGAHGDAPFELFVTDGRQGVAHFDGAKWRVLRPSSSSGPDGTRPDLAWIEPGRAVLVGVEIDAVIEVSSDGTERRVAIPLPPRASRDSVWSTAYVEDRGPVLGSRSSVVFERASGTWSVLPRPPIEPRTDAIISLGRGAFLAGGQGRFAQWRRSDELCEPLSVPSGIDTRVGARLGSGFLLIVDGFEARSVIVGTRVD